MLTVRKGKWKIKDKKKKRKKMKLFVSTILSKMKYFNLLSRITVIFFILLICLLGYEILFLLSFIILFRECNVGGIMIKFLKYFFPLIFILRCGCNKRTVHDSAVHYSTAQLLHHADTN